MEKLNVILFYKDKQLEQQGKHVTRKMSVIDRQGMCAEEKNLMQSNLKSRQRMQSMNDVSGQIWNQTNISGKIECKF